MKHQALVATLCLLLYALIAFLFWQHWTSPAERWPDWTPTEKKAIKALYQKHGPFTLIRSTEGTYFKRDGKIVWIARRSE
jgi:protein-S-isoprenylcysteine O-methyltransferase Ste14